MIGDPLALTIRRKFERPSPTLLRAFRGAPTGFITDAYNGKGCLHHRVKPIDPRMRFLGSAVTALCPPMDNLAAMAILDYVKKGDVIVIATGGDESAGVIGDLWAMRAKQLGVAAIVCDGLVRDVPGLLKVGIPVFARGWAPNSGFKNGPGEINLGVSCAGVTVQPGDIVAGDRDGVVVVPLGAARVVAAQLDAVRKKEAETLAIVKSGKPRKFWDEKALRKRGALRFVD
jgi:4-hydroxy-4-methyl-2-oxoglutarate aldolase